MKNKIQHEMHVRCIAHTERAAKQWKMQRGDSGEYAGEQKYAARNLMSQISYLQLWEMVRQTHSRRTSCW